MRILVYGAGKIGRGFMGQIFDDAGFEVVFVDIVPALIQVLNAERAYRLVFVTPDRRKERVIRGVRAVDGHDMEAVAAEIAGADLVTTCVGVRNLPDIAPFVAAGIVARAERGAPPLDIIIGENLNDASTIFGDLIAPHVSKSHQEYLSVKIGLIDAVIGRAVPEVPAERKDQDPSWILTEPFGKLHVDRAAFQGDIPDVPDMEAHDPIEPYVERKLYVHNCGHAMLAYLGALKGIRYGHEALADPQVHTLLRQAWAESRAALAAEYGFQLEMLQAYQDELAYRFANEALSDTLTRLGRDPIRKLGRRDRLVGPACLALKHGKRPEALAWGIAGALHFAPADDERAQELQAMLAVQGLDHVLATVCSLEPDGTLASMIRSRYQKLTQGGDLP